LSSNFSGVSIGRTNCPKPLRCDLVDRQRRGFCVFDEAEERQRQTCFVMLEDDLDLLTEFKLLRGRCR